MHEKKRKILLICLEVISLLVLIPMFYLGLAKLLIKPIEYYVYGTVPFPLTFLVVLGFDVVWIVLMRLCPRGEIHVKVILTLLVLTFSAAIIIDLMVLSALDSF